MAYRNIIGTQEANMQVESLTETTRREAALAVRRALYDRLPAAAFSIWHGKDLLAVGPNNVDFQGLCDGIVADLVEQGHLT